MWHFFAFSFLSLFLTSCTTECSKQCVSVGNHHQPPEERWSFLTWSSSNRNLHKEESLTILFPNTNLEVLGQVSLKRRPKAQGVGPLNPGGLHSRKEQDCLGSSYKHFQEGRRPEMKPFPPPGLATSLLHLELSKELALLPGLITLTLGFPKPRLSQRGGQLNIVFFTLSAKEEKNSLRQEMACTSFRLNRPNFRLHILAWLAVNCERSALLVSLASRRYFRRKTEITSTAQGQNPYRIHPFPPLCSLT